MYLDDPHGPIDCPIYDREQLRPGMEIAGPAIIEEYASTTLLYQGTVARTASTGELIIDMGIGKEG